MFAGCRASVSGSGPDSVHLRASWMYDLPGYGLPIRGNLPLNLLRAALKGEALRFSRNDHRGVTYVRQVIENLEPAMALPGGVYNFGSGNAENMVCTARQFAETLGIAVQIEEESWGRNLVMDTTKLERRWTESGQSSSTRCSASSLYWP